MSDSKFRELEKEFALLSRPEISDNDLAKWVVENGFEGKIKWCAALGWLEYEAGTWRHGDVTEVRVGELIRRMFDQQLIDEVMTSADARRVTDLAKLKKRSTVMAVLGFVRGIVEVRSDALDGHPDLLNCPNGVVDLRTGALLPSDPDYLFTKVTNAPYEPGTGSYDWHVALQALPAEVHDWFQVVSGQATTGYIPPNELVPIMKGDGENGKTTIMVAIKAALGSYAGVVPEKAIFKEKNDHPTEMMPLRGLRYALLEETSEDQYISSKRLKDIMSPTITARLINKDNVEFKTTHSLFLTTNFTPRVKETDHGTWRRLALVKFPFKYKKGYEVLHGPFERHGMDGLKERLTNEPSAAVLAWLVEGARRWYAGNRLMPEPPATVQLDTREWREVSDTIMGFIDERLEFDPTSAVLANELFDDFTRWRGTGHGVTSMAMKHFTEKFKSHGSVTARSVEMIRKMIGAETPVSRPPWTIDSLPVGRKVGVWIGLKFKDTE